MNRLLASTFLSVLLAGPAMCLDERDFSDPVGVILRHDLVFEGVIVDRTPVYPQDRSMLDWAVTGSANFDPVPEYRHDPSRESGCRLGVRVVDVWLGEAPALLDVDVWWIDPETCQSANVWTEGLEVGARRLFLLHLGDDNIWRPEDYWLPLNQTLPDSRTVEDLLRDAWDDNQIEVISDRARLYLEPDWVEAVSGMDGVERLPDMRHILAAPWNAEPTALSSH